MVEYWSYPFIVAPQYSGVTSPFNFTKFRINIIYTYVITFYTYSLLTELFIHMFSTFQLFLYIFLCVIEIGHHCSKSMIGETHEFNNRSDEVNNVPESVNQPETLDASTFSSITHALAKSPEPNGLTKLPLEMGLPLTPPSQQLKIPDKGMMDAGYDSDFNMGPFVQDGVSAEAFISMEEEAPVEPEPVLVLADRNREKIIPEIAEPVLTEAVIDAMKIVELRSELGKRGMSRNGLKAVLVERLKEAVAQNVPLLEN